MKGSVWPGDFAPHRWQQKNDSAGVRKNRPKLNHLLFIPSLICLKSAFPLLWRSQLTSSSDMFRHEHLRTFFLLLDRAFSVPLFLSMSVTYIIPSAFLLPPLRHRHKNNSNLLSSSCLSTCSILFAHFKPHHLPLQFLLCGGRRKVIRIEYVFGFSISHSLLLLKSCHSSRGEPLAVHSDHPMNCPLHHRRLLRQLVGGTPSPRSDPIRTTPQLRCLRGRRNGQSRQARRYVSRRDGFCVPFIEKKVTYVFGCERNLVVPASKTC